MATAGAEPDLELLTSAFRQVVDVVWRVRVGLLLGPALMGLSIGRAGRSDEAIAMTAILLGVTILGVSVARMARHRAEQRAWRHIFVVVAVATGAAWGSAPFLIDPATPAMAITRVVPAIAVLAMTSVLFAPYLPGFLGVMGGVIVPYTASLLVAGRDIAVEALPGVLTVAGVCTAQAVWSNRRNRDALADRRTLQDLTVRLQQERGAALQANERLHAVNERVRRLAERDHLTGAYNRRVLVERFGTVGADERPRHVLALLDLDHFKAANDRFGHATGDEILSTLVAAAHELLPPDACLARWGGEEFAVLVPGTVPATVDLLDRLRAALAAGLPDGITSTFSAGVAHWTRETDYPELLRRADDALYAAKANGRNRTEVHGASRVTGR